MHFFRLRFYFLINSNFHNFFIDLPRNSEMKKKSKTVRAEKKNNRQGTPCGTNFITSISFISKLSFKFHETWGIKNTNIFKNFGMCSPEPNAFLFRFHRKVLRPKFHKKLGICSPSLKFFQVFFFHYRIICLKKSDFFYQNW